jgi:hypothetical protein
MFKVKNCGFQRTSVKNGIKYATKLCYENVYNTQAQSLCQRAATTARTLPFHATSAGKYTLLFHTFYQYYLSVTRT